MAYGALSGSTQHQQNCITASQIGGLKPILLRTNDGIYYSFLTAPDNMSQVLSTNSDERWRPPAVLDSPTTNYNVNDLVKHLILTSPMYSTIQNEKYVEFNEDLNNELNKDWRLWPQLQYATSQIFAGSILVAPNATALLLNTIEPYSRSKEIDSHYERRMISTESQSSFPVEATKYGHVKVCIVTEDGSKKLKIGLKSSNLLIACSSTLNDKAIPMGPSTFNFSPDINTKIYLNRESLRLARLLIDSKDANCINHDYILYQLRQVRSKFYCLSTYTLCRSFSSASINIAHRPYSIWTYCEYDSPKKTDSQCTKLSWLFQKIALAVIDHGKEARLEMSTLVALKDCLQDGNIKDTVTEIIELIESGSSCIINNLVLDKYLQILANANDTASTLLYHHLYK